MSTLICGSIAYDTIMVFPGRFKEHILPEKLHILNVAFLVPDMRREFGGCAGNIAYNLNLLGGEPLIMAAIGQDGDHYLERLDKLGIPTRSILKVANSYTAQCFVTADENNNQINAFHPGAMQFAHESNVADAGPLRMAIIAPDGRDAMLKHARDCAAQGVPFMFDPGQQLPMFSGAELIEFIDAATYLAANDYEFDMLTERTGLTLNDIAKRVTALIVTRGENGSEIYTEGRRIDIPCVIADAVIDPTGCGDAFRAGLLYGLTNELDWETTGRLASVMGAIKIAHQGGQNHTPSKQEIGDRFEAAFGYRY